MTKNERLCERALDADGWKFIHGGWPDYLCWRNEEIQVVEAKAHRSDLLSLDQERAMTALVRHGVKCFIWAPDMGFREYQPHGDDLTFPQRSRRAPEFDLVSIVGSFAAMRIQQQGSEIFELPTELSEVAS